MTKRVPFKAPDRGAALDAFVAGGEPSAPATRTKAPRAAGGATTRFQADMPPDLHKRFKIACAAEEVTMAEVVAGLIEGWLAERR